MLTERGNPYTNDAPAGFRRSTTSGLILPEEQSRKRVVMTRDEAKAIDRAAKVLNAKGIRMVLGHNVATCNQAPMQRRRLANGDYVYECECTEFLFQQKW